MNHTGQQVQQALDYCQKDPTFFVTMLEALRRGVEFVDAQPQGVLLYDTVSETHMISVKTPQLLEYFCGRIVSTFAVLVHEDWYLEKLCQRFKLGLAVACLQAVYPFSEAPERDRSIAIRPLEIGQLEVVWRYYKRGGKDHLAEQIAEKKLFGAFLAGELAGFVGYHPEGSIGMLYVLEQYRGRGIACALLSFMVADALAAVRVPYSQIEPDNQASLAMHRKLGFFISEQTAYWLFPKSFLEAGS